MSFGDGYGDSLSRNGNSSYH